MINTAHTTRGHEGHTRQEGIHLAGLLVEDISAVALDARRTARHNLAQMVLGEDFHGKMVFKHVDIGVVLDGLDERYLDFVTGVVGMVQDAEFAVTALAVQVKLALLVAVKVHAPPQQCLDLVRRLGDDFLHGFGVVEPVARNHRVVDVLVKVVHFHVGHRGDAALGEVGVGLFHLGLAHQCHSSRLCHLQGKAHTGYTRTDNEVIIFAYHISLLFYYSRCAR